MRAIVLTSIIFLAASCAKVSSTDCGSSAASPCIDMSGIDTTAACLTVYDPVCGCDDKTYSNSCVAAQNGVQAWAEGECCE